METSDKDRRLQILDMERQICLPSIMAHEPGRSFFSGETPLGESWSGRADRAVSTADLHEAVYERHYLCSDAALLAIQRCVGKKRSSLEVASAAVRMLPEDATDIERGVTFAIAQLRWAQLRLHELADVDPA